MPFDIYNKYSILILVTTHLMERFVHYTAHFLIMEHLKHRIATIALSVCVP